MLLLYTKQTGGLALRKGSALSLPTRAMIYLFIPISQFLQ